MHYYGCCERIGYTIPSEDHFQVARNFLTDCESGWDFNPRTELSQSDCVYVDLNCNLYLYEKNFAEYAQILENGESKIWEEKAEQRKALMNRYLWDGEAFMDYNMKQEKTCPVFSVASFYALWAGVANEEQAAKTVAKLSKLEYPYGIAACEKNEVPGQYQWDYPTGWPPHQYLMIQALERYGYKEDARRIAEKYVTVCEKIYQETGDLWEKFHVEKGDQNTEKDYEAHRMIGWAAGVYLFAKHYLEQ